MRYTMFIGLVCLSMVAQAQVYKRVDPFTGQTTYTNVPPPGQAQDEAAPPAPALTAADVRQEPQPRPRARNNEATPTPAAFPRVSAAEQKRRDLDRYAILKEELQSETDALKAVEKKPANNEAARRHRANIASLERELANLR